MENASKALIMAAEALIAILLLSLFAYMFTKMSESSENLENEMNAAKISKYNQQFLNYDGREKRVVGKDEYGNDIYNFLNVQDVATIMNMAIDSNERNEFDNIITVKFGENILVEKGTSNSVVEEFLNTHLTDGYQYKCKVVIDPNTQLVNQINITT